MKYQISSPRIRGILYLSLCLAYLMISLLVMKWLKKRIWKFLNLKNITKLYQVAFKESLRLISGYYLRK